MRMPRSFAVVVIVALVAFGSGASALAVETHDELVAQVQAADLLSDLLTWTSDRAASRVAAMTEYLNETGKLAGFRKTNPAPPKTMSLFYSELFNGAVQFVKGDGTTSADPQLAKLNDAQLFRELTALQTYNIQQFLYLNHKRQECAAVRAYLDSTHGFDGYLTWLKTKYPQTDSASNGTTQPAAQTGAQAVAQLEQAIKTAREAAWQRAKARGMSQVDFNHEWDAGQSMMKAQIAARVSGMAEFARAARASTPPPVQPAGVPINSQIWNGWVDPYPDAFNTTYQGPGLYGDYDTRVDDDYDQRVNGEYDRRLDLGFDRRQNVHIDIRRGV